VSTKVEGSMGSLKPTTRASDLNRAGGRVKKPAVGGTVSGSVAPPGSVLGLMAGLAPGLAPGFAPGEGPADAPGSTTGTTTGPPEPAAPVCPPAGTDADPPPPPPPHAASTRQSAASTNRKRPAFLHRARDAIARNPVEQKARFVTPNNYLLIPLLNACRAGSHRIASVSLVPRGQARRG
jgi:hypothetical protein